MWGRVFQQREQGEQGAGTERPPFNSASPVGARLQGPRLPAVAVPNGLEGHRRGRGCVRSRRGRHGQEVPVPLWLLEVLQVGGSSFPLASSSMVEDGLWFGSELGE